MLKTKNKLLLLTSLIAGLGYGVNAYSQSSYMCMPCPEGTTSDGTTGECKDISTFNYTDYHKNTKAGMGKIILTKGCYKIQLRGAGGGGGKAVSKEGWNNNYDYYGGGGGGSGFLMTKYKCIEKDIALNYYIGFGGNGGAISFLGGGSSAGSGESSKGWADNISITAEGGIGGNSGYFTTHSSYWSGSYTVAHSGTGGLGQENGGNGGDSRGGYGGGPNGGGSEADGSLGSGGGGMSNTYISSKSGKGGDGYIYIYKAI